MDDLYLDGADLFFPVSQRYTDLLSSFVALGITDEVEKFGLKGTKKRKGRKLDEDFVVCLLATFSQYVCDTYSVISRTSNLLP